jgi:hypothetical protein
VREGATRGDANEWRERNLVGAGGWQQCMKAMRADDCIWSNRWMANLADVFVLFVVKDMCREREREKEGASDRDQGYVERERRKRERERR